MSQKQMLVLGGAASGKSAFAEERVRINGKKPVYLATARIWDDEMRRKVDLHRERRTAHWQDIECPLHPQTHLTKLHEDQIVLLDCASMWLTNHLMDNSDLPAAEAALLGALTDCRADCIIVSNDVSGGIVPSDALSRRFRQAQGELNQRLAALADTVVLVTAGLPMVLKGTL